MPDNAMSSTAARKTAGKTARKSRRRAAAAAPVSAPLPHGALFGAPPLFEGEDTAAYEGLVERVAGAVAPADVLEEMWVRDVVDLAWEALRLRRLKATLLSAAAHQGVVAVLRPLIGYATEELVMRWTARDPDAVAKVDGLMATAGLGMDAVRAQTLAVRIDDVERIDRMSREAGSRRDAALHEIARHRAAVAQALRRALAAEAADDEDGEYRDDASHDHASHDDGYRDGRYRDRETDADAAFDGGAPDRRNGAPRAR
jgi:hypothetical protein